ncbi:MAG TPA: restriction endonuclease subunit S [Ktedonobacterales bacterium]|jgi:type I restriction enzyme S subunit|nr:restriction endonuclease subunit S [Ktedonobacterales bacterium]
MTADTLTDTTIPHAPTYPAHWRMVRLGDAFRFTKKPRELRLDGYAVIPFIPMEYVPIGSPVFSAYQMKAADELTSGTYIEDGDLLVAKITPSFENGKQGIIESLPLPFGYATTEVIPINGIPGVSDKRFLASYLLRSGVRAALAAKMEGSTGRQRLSASTLANLKIMLPPLAEQRAIARILRAAQNAIAARRRQVTLERERKAALMQRLFTHGVRGEPTKQTEIGEMPQSWQVVRLGEIADVAYGLTVNETRRKCLRTAPYLTVANVTRGALRLDEVKQIGMLDGDSERFRVHKGDVLLVEGNGNPKLLGSAAIWRDELPFALHQNHLIRARPNQDVICSSWLAEYINGDDGRAQLLGRSKTSSGLQSINSRVVSELSIPLPSLSEQREIADILAACDAHIAALEREIALHEELFRALLEEMMSGRLSALLVEKTASGKA